MQALILISNLTLENFNKTPHYVPIRLGHTVLRGTVSLFNITVIQVYAPTSNAEEAEVERFYEDLQDLLELTPKKRCPFYYRGLKCKSRKSRNTWGNRQIWPWNME